MKNNIINYKMLSLQFLSIDEWNIYKNSTLTVSANFGSLILAQWEVIKCHVIKFDH